MAYTKKPKFSHSKLNVLDSCGWRYNLTYNEGHYIFMPSLANELGTLIHSCEESIARSLKQKEPINYDKLKKDLFDINIPKKNPWDVDGGIYGINILKERYAEDYYKVDDRGQSYHTKVQNYLNYGIYRLENYLKANPNLEVFAMEKFFSIDYNGNTVSGYIDRIFYDKVNDKYIIEDIKTKGKPFKDDELVTPLQFVIYSRALIDSLDLSEDQVSCCYDLPLCDLKQPAGTPGFFKRGEKKLQKLFKRIDEKDWAASPTPLCAWCPFSPTNPNQPEEGKNLCPYYSLWTPTNRTHEVANKWQGLEKHAEIMEKEKNKVKEEDDFEF